MFNGRRAEWNGGWEGCEPCPYTVLSEHDFALQLERTAFSCKRGTADCATFQPFPAPNVNQDRYVVHQFAAGGAQWKLWGVFDGHAGHTTVDLAARSLPLIIMKGIAGMLEQAPTIAPAQMREFLTQTVVAFDESITQGVHELFPGGADAIARMSDDEIRQVVVVNNWTHPAISRCLTGTTVLVAILDPARNLYVCSLGDCQAVLGIKDAEGAWKASLVSANHNGREVDEVARVRAEHPDEPECILEDRVLGGIAVTRALGDQVFKLPTIYTERVFNIADPSAYIYTRLAAILARNHTPPYVSNVPEVQHVDLSSTATEDTILILASDGLADLYQTEQDLEGAAKRWVRTATEFDPKKPAIQLIRAGMAGGEVEKASWYLTVEMDSPWLDDITVVVDKL